MKLISLPGFGIVAKSTLCPLKSPLRIICGTYNDNDH